jgi:microcystin-dependent protein
MEPFIGQIQIFGFNYAPRNWALCNGATLAIRQNTALFSLLGTAYGGDGTDYLHAAELRRPHRLQSRPGRGSDAAQYR